jgi:hypothetical protein
MCKTLAMLHPNLKATKNHSLQDADPTAEVEANIHMALKELDTASSDLLLAYADALPSRDLPTSVRVNDRCFAIFREMVQAGAILVDQHDALVNLLETPEYLTTRDVLTHSMFRPELALEGFKLGTANLHFVISGWGCRGSKRGQFHEARDLAVSSTGEVYVCDYGRVQVFDSQGYFARAWNLPSPVHLAGICVAPWGDVYVVEEDSTRVHRFSESGELVSTWTHCRVTYDSPVDVAASADEVYVLSSCMRVFTPDGQFVRAWDVIPKARSVCIGPDGHVHIVSKTHLHVYDSQGNDIAARDGLRVARRVHVTAEKAYVTESQHVRVFKMDGTLVGAIGHSKSPRAVAATPDRVYICEANSIEITAT